MRPQNAVLAALLLAPLLASSAGCKRRTATSVSSPRSNQPPLPKPASPPKNHRRTYSSVRDVPWKNRVYDFGEGVPERFHDGFYSQLDETGNCAVCEAIVGISYGDVDNDGAEEAIVLTTTNLGGAGNVTKAYVFKLVDGTPKMIASIEGGDRGNGGLESAAAETGHIVVRRFNSLPQDGACCPSQVIVEDWRWINGRLVKSPAPIRVERRQPKRWDADWKLHALPR